MKILAAAQEFLSSAVLLCEIEVIATLAGGL
jgi:hypothetical protein